MSDAAQPRVLTVLEFTNGMAAWFNAKSQLREISISGEVSNFSYWNGHRYFKIKEGAAILDCVLFESAGRAVTPFENGNAVIATGQIKVRAESSGYQLIATSVDLTGIGALFQEYEQLKAKFREEGLFESARKRAIPELPRRVALVSARARGAEDFIKAMSQVPFVSVTLIETRLQGHGAEIDIAEAIDTASKMNVDVIVVARGGGSYEDRFPFSLEPVIRAIVRSRHPVVTGIGHSSDHHLADDIADMQFGSPSMVGDSIANAWKAALTRLRGLVRDLEREGQQRVDRAEQVLQTRRERTLRALEKCVSEKRAALNACMQRIERVNPQRVLAQRVARIAENSARLDAAVQRIVDQVGRDSSDRGTLLDRSIGQFQVTIERRLERAHDALDRLDPQAPLLRGYAIVTKAGRAVMNAGQLQRDDALEARFGRGIASLRVETSNPDA